MICNSVTFYAICSDRKGQEKNNFPGAKELENL